MEIKKEKKNTLAPSTTVVVTTEKYIGVYPKEVGTPTRGVFLYRGGWGRGTKRVRGWGVNLKSQHRLCGTLCIGELVLVCEYLGGRGTVGSAPVAVLEAYPLSESVGVVSHAERSEARRFCCLLLALTC